MTLSRKFLCVAASLTACTAPVTTTNSPAQTDFLAANMDPSVNPGQDFFTYANGGWLKRNPIPNTESSWGIGNVVREQLYLNLRSINEQSAAAPAAPGSDAQKIGDFWATAMDTAKAERLGIHPLDGELARIATIRNVNDVLDVAFAENPIQVGPLFSFYVYQDERKSDRAHGKRSKDPTPRETAGSEALPIEPQPGKDGKAQLRQYERLGGIS